MNWHSLKELYARFRRWQHQPMRYVQGEVEHRCNNCGFSFTGHSACKLWAHRVAKRAPERDGHVGLGIAFAFCSVLYSVWQLLFRTGYFISDYISGKRQMSFPPVKMLFILAVAYAVIFPTWVMFRYSPRHTRHTLPEGFFIQVLFATLEVSIFLLMVPCWFIFKQMTVISVIFLVVTAYYVVGYK